MSKAARIKGVDILGTGDCLFRPWLDELESNLEKVGDRYEHAGVAYIIQAEVETTIGGRIHHLLFFPSLSSAYKLHDIILEGGYSQLTSGRPQLKISPEGLVSLALGVDALIGPSHAFTPWTSMYASFESIHDCYGKNTKHVTFVELGLSADTQMASKIAELDAYTFITCSDAHSPSPDKIGREITRFYLNQASFREINEAFEGVNGRKIVLNVGLDPREGKYHLTGCRRCKKAYNLEDITVEGKVLKTCPACGGPLKIGVKDRIYLMTLKSSEVSTARRPPYMHTVPLTEILKAMKKSQRLDVKEVYEALMQQFDNEIAVLIDSPLTSIKDHQPRLAEILERFRDDAIDFEFVGRGGWYGKIII